MNERRSSVPRDLLRHFKGISKITGNLQSELRPSHDHERPASQLFGNEHALNREIQPWRLDELIAPDCRDKVLR
jgi:hypothetical protein